MKEVFSYILVFLIIIITLSISFSSDFFLGEKIKLISSKESGKVVQEPEGEVQQLREVGVGSYNVVVNGQIVASVKDSGVNFNHKDRLGSNVVTSFDSVRSYSKTLPFGQELLNPEHRNTFTGKELDETNLYYFNARYYNPDLGRFISTDIVMDNQPYAYANNNPLKYIDPTGNDEEIAENFLNVVRSDNYNDVITASTMGGVRPMGISGYFRGVLAQHNVYASIKRASELSGVDIYSLTGAIFQEGLNVVLDQDHKYLNGNEYKLNNVWPVGIEAFGSSINNLKINGYLREDFSEYKFTGNFYENEYGESFPWVFFQDLNIFTEAFAAIYAERIDLFLHDAMELGYDVSKFEQPIIDAWAYSYYINPSAARSNLQTGGPDLVNTPVKSEGSVRFSGQRAAATSMLYRQYDVFEKDEENFATN